MSCFFIIVFIVSVVGVAHSYLFYPLLMQLLAGFKKQNEIVFEPNSDQLPEVIILLSVYNEQKVISQKIESILASDYPKNKLQLWIGSDNSTDETVAIIQSYQKEHSFIRLFAYMDRNGKAGVLNRLHKVLNEEYSPEQLEKIALILTDANVFFEPQLVYELVKHFRNSQIAQVGANIQNSGLRDDGISLHERNYIQRENRIKYYEGLFGVMQGAFGGCYALRASRFPSVPPHFLMEDFFISLSVLERPERAIFAPKALCMEDVSNEVNEEFKRKTRISAGNFQNLLAYWKLLLRFDFNAFCFFSHKMLRWFTPLFLLFSFISALFLVHYDLFKVIIVLQLLLFVSPFIDLQLKKRSIHIKLVRLAAYFVQMNIALVKGFELFLKGVQTSAWTPTKRNVEQ